MNLLRFLPVLLTLFTVSVAAQSDYAAQKSRAEKFFAEKSYSRAEKIYRDVDLTRLPESEKRWVQFRISDAIWRSESSTSKADQSKLNLASQSLEKMVRDVSRPEDKDRVYAEVKESIGDHWWTRRNGRNWHQAWQHYTAALDYWAGARDVELARDRYMAIIRRVVEPPNVQRYYYYGYHGNNIPIAIARNVLKIAQSAQDKAYANYVMAMSIRSTGGSMELRMLVPEYFEAALAAGKQVPWYDDALHYYAQYVESPGRAVPLDNGGWNYVPDYVEAVKLYRRLVREFKEGESRHWRNAQNKIKQITSATANVSVSHTFLPDSEIQYHLSWRNVKEVRLSLHPVDLTRDTKLSRHQTYTRSWVQTVELDESVLKWTIETGDQGKHVPGSRQLRVDKKLRPGAYILVAKAGDLTRREIVLVTDASLVIKSNNKQVLLYYCDAISGAPIPDAKVKLFARYRESRKWLTQSYDLRTDKDGIAKVKVTTPRGRGPELLAAAIKGDRQAYGLSNTYYYNRRNDGWKTYVYTDRPAYRPEETVEWKMIVRQYFSGVYHTHPGRKIRYEIHDPRGTKVHTGKVDLNEFGTAWGQFKPTKSSPLGEYNIRLYLDSGNDSVGAAKLFRLEEYKLPEFKVAVKTPEEDGKKKTFRVGDRVDVTIQADYYFGGPVVNANVEVTVHQRQYWHRWFRQREFPWFYQDVDPQPTRYGYRGNQVKREVLKTDAEGKVTLSIDTPQGANQDYEYTIEARVTDASRREIVSQGSVKVGRQRYYVHSKPSHNIHRPNDKVTVEFAATDINRDPFQTTGEVTVTRDYWWEIWLDPNGREVKGDDLKARKSDGPFPPAQKPGEKKWRIKFRGYEKDEILTQKVTLDKEGKAELDFTPTKDGYYRVRWQSEDVIRETPRLAKAITSDTTVWVCTSKTTELGYRHGGLQIIVDKDTFRVGEKAPVMLMTPDNERFVLFSTEADDLFSYQLVHMSGRVKLVTLDITEREVPNVYLSGTMVHDKNIHIASQQVIVPPTKNFLTVEVEPDKAEYQAREDGTLVVTTRDHEGKPVSAEVSVGLVDESVYYIQSDYAGDPRKHFYGRKRPNQTRNQSTFNQKSYTKLVFDPVTKQVMQRHQYEYLQSRRKNNDTNEEEADKSDAQVFADRDSNRGLREFSRRSGSMAVASTPAPMSAPAEASTMASADAAPANRLRAAKRAPARDDTVGGGPGGNEVVVQVRNDFRSTVIWQPTVKTDANGKAKVKVKYPDSLTGWKATARAVSKGNQFGIAEAATRTRQPLIVRLQAPRFFVVGDKVTISAVINNNTKKSQTVTAELDTAGIPIEQDMEDSVLTIPANSEKRVDWVLHLGSAGNLRLRATAKSSQYGDAMEKSYVVHEHGIEKFVAKSGKVRGEDITIKLNVPKARKRETTTMTVQVTPSMAVTMLDALPYLINYPYGCTEQTMSRFLPTVLTMKTLKDLGLQNEDIASRVFGGIEQAHVDKTQPKGKQDLAKMNAMVKAGLNRLYDFQHSDGGWGWWKEGSSDHWMTAYVVWGLVLAREAGVEVKDIALRKGADFLDKRLVEEELNPDMQAWMLHALGSYWNKDKMYRFGRHRKTAFENLYKNRERLNAYTRSLLALTAHYYDQKAQAKVLIRNLENGVITDKRPDDSVLIAGRPKNKGVIGTAHWGNDGVYHRWSEGGGEATAFALRALLEVSPKNKLIEPVTNWLIKNRRGAQWSNTRDTAIVIMAMNDYLKVSGELEPEMEYEITVNGRSIVKKKITAKDVFQAPSRFTIDPKLIRDGNNQIRITRKGEGAFYFAAETTYFSLEEPIPPAGNEIFVKREYYKLVGRPTLLKGHVYDKVKVQDGDSINSSERIETILTIEAKNNYEYLLFEDLKPAGFEAVQVRSGESLYAKQLQGNAQIAALVPPPIPGARKPAGGDFTGHSRWVYQELRDRKIAMFIDKLPEGLWQIKYTLRAEVPGQFHALPVLGHAMYVPEIRCNGAEIRVTVKD
ncbi:MAG: alpha-2-macroglobulin family protein [Limisphaerales bacterium]